MTTTVEAVSGRVAPAVAPALAGIVAVAAGLGVAELVAGWTGRPTPVVAVGGEVVDRVPAPVKDWAITAFGTADKVVLVAGVVVVLAAVAAAAGVLAVTHRRAGLALAAALVAAAGLAVVGRPGSGAVDLLPTAVGGAVGLAALDQLVGRVPPRPLVAAPARGGPDGPDSAASRAADVAGEAQAASRRTFLRAVGLVALLGGVAAAGGRWLFGRREAVEAARAALVLPRPLPDAVPPPGTGVDVDGAVPWRTPNDRFYRIDTALSLPLVHPDEWRLRVHGLVEHEVELDLDDLVGRGLVDRWVTLTCVSNEVGGELAGNALWTGVPVAALLAESRPRADADMVLSTSVDGWTASTPLDVLGDGRDALLAVGMNGEPLPVRHGFPVRMVVPGLYGYVSATKWVVDLEVTRFDRAEAYWTSRGWSARGPVKTASRIDVPRAGAPPAAGLVTVAGTAWAQHRGVEAVEVRVDEGPWQQAQLAAVPSVDTWRQWVWEWDAPRGTHRLEVRAVDGTGEAQTGEVVPPAPDGATGWHAVTVDVT
ncbi:MAG TPA: molybdopterin-dependent oxidoreductase [Jiangellales bacterium]|nr:molybdopterin-dependent oxidoreductase [Jiangellales bacterium]